MQVTPEQLLRLEVERTLHQLRSHDSEIEDVAEELLYVEQMRDARGNEVPVTSRRT